MVFIGLEAGALIFTFSVTFGFTILLGLDTGVLDADFLSIIVVASESAVFVSGFIGVVFFELESIVLSERFITLNGLGVVVE